jgi:hypothetical protein
VTRATTAPHAHKLPSAQVNFGARNFAAPSVTPLYTWGLLQPDGDEPREPRTAPDDGWTTRPPPHSSGAAQVRQRPTASSTSSGPASHPGSWPRPSRASVAAHRAPPCRRANTTRDQASTTWTSGRRSRLIAPCPTPGPVPARTGRGRRQPAPRIPARPAPADPGRSPFGHPHQAPPHRPDRSSPQSLAGLMPLGLVVSPLILAATATLVQGSRSLLG